MRVRTRNRLFLLFIFVVGLMTIGSLAFIQSSFFASIVQRILVSRIPSNVGLNVSFDGFSIQYFPPGVSLVKPVISVKANSKVMLEEGSLIRAENLNINFHPFQMLTGTIRAHEVRIVDGEITLRLDPKKLNSDQKKEQKTGIEWDELLKFRAEAIALENSQVRVEWLSPDVVVNFHSNSLKVSQWRGKGGVGYFMDLDLSNAHLVSAENLGLPKSVESLKASLRLNSIGAQIESFSVRMPGLQAKVSGGIQGNILRPKSLVLDTTVDLSADLKKSLKVFGQEKFSEGAHGTVSFQGSFSGDPSKFPQHVSAQGVLGGTDIRFEGWEADSITAEGLWRGTQPNAPGEVNLKRLVVSRAKRDRVIPNQLATGGRLIVEGLQYRFGSAEPLLIPLQLEEAHVHWLAGPQANWYYYLGGRLSGETLVKVSSPLDSTKRFIELPLNHLRFTDFQYDNQILGESKPVSILMAHPEIALGGKVILDGTQVTLSSVKTTFSTSSLSWNGFFQYGGKRDVVGVSERIDFSEVKKVSGVPIRGVGTMKASFQGETKENTTRVEIQAQDFEYAWMNLGKVDMDFSISSKTGVLKFLRYEGIVNKRSHYSLTGSVDLRVWEGMDVNVAFKRADINDLFQMGSQYTSSLWWWPSSLSGEVTEFRAKITGGYLASNMEVVTQLGGKNWDYKGERFDSISSTVVYNRGLYELKNIIARKQRGKIKGQIQYDLKSGLDWNLWTENLDLSNLDRFASLSVPFRGRISFRSKGKGYLPTMVSDTRIELRNFSVKGRKYPASEFRIATNKKYLDLRARVFGGQGKADVRYGLEKGMPSQLAMRASAFDFSALMLYLKPNLMTDQKAMGLLSGTSEIQFASGSIEKGSGKLQLDGFVYKKSGVELVLKDPVEVSVNGGSWKEFVAQFGGVGNTATLQLASQSGQLRGAVTGEVHIGIMEFFASGVQDSKGNLGLDFTVGGTVKKPEIIGKVLLKSNEIQIPAMNTAWENITGTIRVKPGLITLSGLEGDMGGGTLRASGTVNFTEGTPKLDVLLNMDATKIRVYPLNYGKFNGYVRVVGKQAPWTIEGDLTMTEGLTRMPVMGRATAQKRVAKYQPKPLSAQEGGNSYFDLKVHLRVPKNMMVKNDLFDAEFKADLNFINTLWIPRVLGEVEAVRGIVKFKEHDFNIESCKMTFYDPTSFNSKYVLYASTQVNDIAVKLYIKGDGWKWKAEFSSNPAMPEREIISLLALGYTESDLEKLRGTDQAGVQQGQAASLLLHSMEFNRDVEEKTGIRVEISESKDEQGAASITRSDAEGESAPKIVLKRKIGKRVEISAGSTVGVGTASEQEVNAAVKVAPGVSVIGVWNTYEGSSPQSDENSYGVDLKFQKRF